DRGRLSCHARALAGAVRAAVLATAGDAGGWERFPCRPHRAVESHDAVPSNGAIRVAAEVIGERSRRARGVARRQVVLSCGWTPRVDEVDNDDAPRRSSTA